MTADEVKQTLRLVEHPREGGWYIRTYEADHWIEAAALGEARYTGSRRTATAIYYLLEADTFSEMHRLRSDEVFHFYAGDAVEQLQLLADGSGRQLIIGNDLAAGAQPQVVVTRGVWQGARLAAGGQWALLGCTVSPGFEFADYESGAAEELVRGWPEWETAIRALCRR